MSNRIKQTAEKAGAYASEKLGSAKAQLGEAAETARTSARSARQKASDGFETAKASLAEAGESAVATIEDNPASALIGGIALGALLGSLLPRTSAETKTLGPIGARINAAAKDAASAARVAGGEKLAELGITKEAARQNAGKLIGNALLAAVTASDAAVGAARKKKAA
jgi:F0F1-type ATP synthase assembly protein I